MTVWETARGASWSTKAVIAAAVLALLLVAAVPVALLAGLVLMLLGHVIVGLALFGGSILAAGGGVAVAAATGVWRVRKLVSQLRGTRDDQGSQDIRVVQLGQGEYHYS
jgi:hypothetical protein